MPGRETHNKETSQAINYMIILLTIGPFSLCLSVSTLSFRLVDVPSLPACPNPFHGKYYMQITTHRTHVTRMSCSEEIFTFSLKENHLKDGRTNETNGTEQEYQDN